MLLYLEDEMRVFRYLALLLVLSLVLGACAPAATPVPQAQPPVVEEPAVVVEEKPAPTKAPAPTMAVEEAEVSVAEKYNQSPMLDALVDAGKLPPVDERLPENPAVVNAMKEVGSYGGELRVGFEGGSPAWGGMLYIAGWENPMIWKADFSGVVPNFLESLSANEDATHWTMKLRKGLKWSDGEPFTTEDLAFYIEDVLLNPEISPDGLIVDWVPGDMAAEFVHEVVDEYTIIMKFPRSYGVFPYTLAGWGGRQFVMYPKHYLSQFHASYNDNLDALIAAEGVETWTGLFLRKGPDGWGNPDFAFFNTPEYPTMGPWRVVQPLGTGTQIQLERNPYYWKVDQEGNQLPYVDKVLGISYQDAQSRTLAMLNGDLDHIKDPGDTRALYYQAMDEGKPIQINETLSDGANGMVLQFNMSNPDPVKSEVFSNKDFRIGVSYAIDRAELIELFNSGQGYPSQVCPLPDSPLYVPKCNDQYIEYDLDKANEYLDKVLPEKNAQGVRLGPDGKPFTFVLTAINTWTWAPRNAELGEVLVGYMKDVGLDVLLNIASDEQHDVVRLNNTVEAFISTGEGGGGITGLLDARNYAPMEQFGQWGNGWALWRQKPNGATGEVEPPQWVVDARQKYNDALAAPTQEEQIAKMRLVVEEATERYYQVGGYQGGSGWYPFHSRLGNLADQWYGGWIQGVTKILYPEQWYIKQ
jgi:peptide/nickel transport system substrate-binding protein